MAAPPLCGTVSAHRRVAIACRSPSPPRPASSSRAGRSVPFPPGPRRAVPAARRGAPRVRRCCCAAHAGAAPRRRRAGSGVSLGRLLRQPGGSGEHPGRPDVHVDQLDAVVGKHELPHLIGVRGAPRFQHEQQPVAFAVGLDAAHQQPVVHHRRHIDHARLGALPQRGDQERDPFAPEQVELARDSRGHFRSVQPLARLVIPSSTATDGATSSRAGPAPPGGPPARRRKAAPPRCAAGPPRPTAADPSRASACSAGPVRVTPRTRSTIPAHPARRPHRSGAPRAMSCPSPPSR